MASANRSQYLYLSDKDWTTYKTDPVKLESLTDFKKNELVEKLANFSLSKETFNDKIPTQSMEKNELRLVIIGKTGQGKSATANTILGEMRFDADFTARSVTRESRRITELVDGRKISVMDTPGLQDTHQSNEHILKELARITTLFPDGVHAFVYVMNMADPRFTAEDKNVLDLIEKTFGGDFKNYCLLVFSHGDSALKDIDLDTYRKKQMALGQATRGHPTTQYSRKDQSGQDQDQKSLANLLDELSWKILAIDNKTSIPFEKAHYRTQIVAMVDRMRTLNSPEIYTNDMFVKAQQEREAIRQKGLRKGWDPLIMSKVEAMIAANPDISQGKLQVEVSRQLQEEHHNKKMELQRKEEEFEKRRISEEKRLQEQKRVDEEKREAEEKERRKRQEKEDQERKDKFQVEERERQELREREDRERKLRQEQQVIYTRNLFQREDIEMQRRLAEEQQKYAQQIQLQRDEWEKRRREEEKSEVRQQRQQDMWEKQFREDRERRERERRWEKQMEEKERADREKRHVEAEVHRLRQEMENLKRLQKDEHLKEQVEEIRDEHDNGYEHIYNGVITIAKLAWQMFV